MDVRDIEEYSRCRGMFGLKRNACYIRGILGVKLEREFFWRGNCSNYRSSNCRKFRITKVQIVESVLLEIPKENWWWLRFSSNYRKFRIGESFVKFMILFLVYNHWSINHQLVEENLHNCLNPLFKVSV